MSRVKNVSFVCSKCYNTDEWSTACAWRQAMGAQTLKQKATVRREKYQT